MPTDVADLTPADERLIEQRMRSDPQLRAVGRAIAESALPAADRRGSEGRHYGRAAETTLMSPHIVDEVQQGAARPGEEGLVTAAVLAKHAVSVVRNVFRRFRAGRDHGVYPTVVEEILREFYAANAGGRIWTAMKQETTDTFVEATPARGGATFMRLLGGSLRGGAEARDHARRPQHRGRVHQ